MPSFFFLALLFDFFACLLLASFDFCFLLASHSCLAQKQVLLLILSWEWLEQRFTLALASSFQLRQIYLRGSHFP